jgi:bacteriorhodopsin
VVILDLLVIGSRYLAVREPDIKKKWALFTVGCLLLIPILYVLFQQKKHKAAIYLTILIWILYPVILVVEETHLLTEKVITCTYSVLDMITKVGLVYLLQA